MTTNEHRRKVLGKLGFKRKREGQAGHEKWVLEEPDGRAALTTQVSRGSKEIPPPVLKKIIQGLHLKAREYTDVAACTMSKNQYSRLLAERFPL